MTQRIRGITDDEATGDAIRGALLDMAKRVEVQDMFVLYLAGHGVPPDVIGAAFEASREFHALPLEDKLRLKLNENNIGYLPVNQSIQGASTIHKATRPNYNESFFISHDRPADHRDVVAGTPLRGRNQWPEGHDRIRAAMVASRPHAPSCCPVNI